MATALYQIDFYNWALRQAGLLRNEEYAELDLENLIEEIEALAKRDRRELGRRLTRILEHLLKLLYEPQSRAQRQWRQSILTQRLELARFFQTNHSLRNQVHEFVDDAYQDARKLAAAGVDANVADFPAQCPWTTAQILDVDWLP
jgi:Domain of unknown function DUF29